MTKRVLVGITPEDEIYFLEIEPKSKEHDYFSMSAFTLLPLKYDEAVERSRESLEDGELWRGAVEAEQTEMSLNDWVDWVLDSDGEISMIDTSYFPETITANGTDYIFESMSGGQHEVEKLKEYFIPEAVFNTLMRTWKQYHLKKVDVMLPELPEQYFAEIIQKYLERKEGGENE